MKAPKRMTKRLATLESMIAELKVQIAEEEAKSTEDVVCDLRERVEELEAERDQYLKLSTEGVQSFFSKHKGSLWPIATVVSVIGVAAMWNPVILLLLAFGGLGVIGYMKSNKKG